jgi:hypothetical protein
MDGLTPVHRDPRKRRALETAATDVPDVLAQLGRDWHALRTALHGASLAAHEGCRGAAAVRLRECPSPECVYRVGLLDRTGPRLGRATT